MANYAVAEVSFRVQGTDPTASGCSTVGCELSGVLLDPTVVTGAILLAISCFVAFTYIKEARSCCREERRRVADERDAFGEFAKRISRLTPTDTAGTGSASARTRPDDAAPTTGGPVVGAHSGFNVRDDRDPGLDQVVDAYRETVTAVPHFEEEYDETVSESLAEELGHDTAVVTVSGTTLSSGLQSALLARSRQARESRAELLDAIDEEMDALDAAESRLSAIDRQRQMLLEHLEETPTRASYDAAVDIWHRLSELEDRCESAVEDRQAQVRNPPMDSDDSAPFYEYLYSSLAETTHPVLAQFSELADQIRADRRRVEGGLVGGG